MSKHKGGIYLIRCRKPGAFLGLPLLGRHTAYVGMTNSYYHRERQHFHGDTHWGSAPKPWADLKPKFYKIIPLPNVRFLMHIVEAVMIWLLCPVYNVQLQPPYNLRRCTSTKARSQRWARDQLGIGYKIMRTAVRGALLLAVLGVVGYGILTHATS